MLVTALWISFTHDLVDMGELFTIKSKNGIIDIVMWGRVNKCYVL